MTKQAKYTNSDIIQSFTAFRTLMDTKNDKFERIVKMSRDVTITSKRIIFNLHRISPDLDNKVAVLAESKEKLHNLIPIFERIGSELEGEDVYLYFRAYTNGVQEFIEAISFYHVIVSEAVIRPDQLSEYFGPLMCPLINSDYFGGIADLTGEMMRMCISFIGRGDVETGNRLRELLYQVSGALFDSLKQFLNVASAFCMPYCNPGNVTVLTFSNPLTGECWSNVPQPL